MTNGSAMATNTVFMSTARTVLLVTLSFFALVVAFHDYPEHEHFEFAHELLAKDAPDKNLPSELLSALDGLRTMSALPAPAAQEVGTIHVPAEPVLFSKGYRANWSGLAPPAVSLSAAPSLPSAVSRFIFLCTLFFGLSAFFRSPHVGERIFHLSSEHVGYRFHKKGDWVMQSRMKSAFPLIAAATDFTVLPQLQGSGIPEEAR